MKELSCDVSSLLCGQNMLSPSDIVRLKVSNKYLKSYPFFNEFSKTDSGEYCESR